MRPVPANALYQFPRFAADDSIVTTLNTPPAGGFSFLQYLLLSVSAGVITHYVIRSLERKRK